MRRDQQDQDKKPEIGGRQLYSALLMIALVMSAATQLYCRKVGTMGRRYLSFHFVAGLALGFVFEVAMNPVGDHTPMMLFTAVGGSLLILHWLKRNKNTHSLYCGDSGLGNHKLVYTMFEPALAMLVGVGCLYLSPALGAYLIVSGFSSSLVFAHLESRDAARLRAISDGEHENRAYMAAHREGRDS